MQKKMNLKIKKRESFRPFAPIVLLEEAARWFEWDSKVESEFMLFVSNVNPKKLLKQDPENDSQALLTDRLGIVRSQIPAVTHVDNSARLQTINKVHPFRNVLEEFHKITGVPVLINTSFNVRNEPIVESPIDALKCFMTTDIDMLAIDKFLIKKIDQHESLIYQWRKFVYSGEND
jgi:carbamoyltransferase